MKSLLLALAFLVALPASAETTLNRDGMVMCSMEYAPVCGRKHVECVRAPCNPVYETYGNSCMMRASGAELVHVGECTDIVTRPTVSSEEPYTPPSGCTAWFDGCNSCSGDSGGATCSKKACTTYAPGYCTMWKQTTPPASVDVRVDAEVAVEATTTATTTTARASFFTRVWGFLFGWL